MVLKQLPVPASLFITRLLYRNILVLAHNAIIVAIVLIAFPQSWTVSILLLPVSVVLVVLNLWWLSVVISIASARFRDIPPIVASLLQILFFVSPVIWRKEDLPKHALLADINPFYHLIEILRAPLMGSAVPVLSLILCAVAAIVGTVGALHLRKWARSALSIWILS